MKRTILTDKQIAMMFEFYKGGTTPAHLCEMYDITEGQFHGLRKKYGVPPQNETMSKCAKMSHNKKENHSQICIEDSFEMSEDYDSNKTYELRFTYDSKSDILKKLLCEFIDVWFDNQF